ncbi:facilitated trehalose transporter Tret1-like [Aedes albopictus]|uniref:Major facilitator superfamily (MFS) profile domain-containing protein n=1 Tax=Aedes albopictus TaxID=7160 RepID=A0ABM1XQZ4_AEDAL
MGLSRSVVVENFPFKSVLNQFLGAIAVNIITISHGAAIGWVSPFLPYLQSSESHLTSGSVSIEQASWIGSLLCIGGMIGAPLFGLLADRFGKKLGLQLIVIPHVAFWLCILYGPNVYFIYLGRILAGSGGGGILRAIPLYIADIAHSKLRGMLGSVLVISLNVGILLGFVLGDSLSYFTVPYVMLVAPTLFVACTCFLPETPYCLLKQNRTEKAELSLMFYRGVEGHFQKTDDFRKEFEQMKKLAQLTEDPSEEHKLSWRDFCTKQARKGLGIGIFLMALNQFCGALAIITYSANIFTESGSDLSPNVSSIIVALIQLTGTAVSFILVDNLGRKILLLISTIGTTAGLFSMGIFSFLQHSGHDLSELGSLPILSLSFTILFSSFGILPLPYVILAEVLPQKIRNVGSTISILMISTSAFVVLKLFPIMIDRLHLYGAMWFHASICAISIFVILFAVPETKGKDLLTVEEKPDIVERKETDI